MFCTVSLKQINFSEELFRVGLQIKRTKSKIPIPVSKSTATEDSGEPKEIQTDFGDDVEEVDLKGVEIASSFVSCPITNTQGTNTETKNASNPEVNIWFYAFTKDFGFIEFYLLSIHSSIHFSSSSSKSLKFSKISLGYLSALQKYAGFLFVFLFSKQIAICYYSTAFLFHVCFHFFFLNNINLHR